jgi:G3E family GTPase
MVDQIEFADVVILNKTDMVSLHHSKAVHAQI